MNIPINHFAAEWNGQTLMALTDAPNSGYQLYTFDVVGINGNSVLEFDAYNHPDAWRLDDVTLTAVGAPAAVAGSISINDVTISEGDSGTKAATFTVTRSGGTAAFDVNYATSDGTATVTDSDYVAASNTLHFGANQNTQTISVTINGDSKVEANETFNVGLSMRPMAPPSTTVKVSAPSPTMMAHRRRAARLRSGPWTA